MGLFNKKKKEEIISETPSGTLIQLKEQPKKIYTARIVGCNLRDDGLKEYIILSNTELGELGEEFEI